MDSNELLIAFTVLLSGLAVTSIFIPSVVKFALRCGAIDFPNARRIHQRPMPRAGGIAVFLGFHCSCVLLFLLIPLDGGEIVNARWWMKFFLGSSFIAFVGLIDDLQSMRPIFKLSGQACGALILYLSDVHVGEMFGVVLPNYFDLIVTVFWFLLLTNAFNLIDGIDGLATGLGAIAGLGIFGTLLLRGLNVEALLVLCFVGSCAGFLRYNRYPARVFLGDTGSNFIGFFLASITAATGSKGSAIAGLWIPLLAFSIPLLDTGLAVWRRTLRKLMHARNAADDSTKRGIMEADLEHLHHRLMQLGISPQNVSASLWLATSVLVLVGLVTLSIPEMAPMILLCTLSLSAFVLVRYVPLVELSESSRAVLDGLELPRGRFVAFLVFRAVDALGITAALFAAMRFMHPALPFEVLWSVWWNALPNWCGAPFLGLLLVEATRIRKQPRTSMHFTLVFLAIAAGMALNSVGSTNASNESPQVILLQTLLFFGFSITAIAGLRVLPAVLVRETDQSDEPRTRRATLRRATSFPKRARQRVVPSRKDSAEGEKVLYD